MFRFTLRSLEATVSRSMLAAVAVVVLGFQFAGPAHAQLKGQEPLEANEAQQIMLQSDHFGDIKKPNILRYGFKRISGKKNDSYEDTIDVKILKLNDDGTKHLSYDFFKGKKRRPYPDHERFRTNGVIVHSLTRDVWEMARAVGGHAQQANYFGKRVNMALRNNPTLEDVMIDIDGKQQKAKKVTVQPFVKDPNVSKFAKFEQKVYEFYFVDSVPGKFYMLRTYVPTAEAQKEGGPEVEEVVKFQAMLPLN